MRAIALAILFTLGVAAGHAMANPEVITVEVPGPERVVENRIEVVPQACEDLFQVVIEQSMRDTEFILNTFGAYIEWPDESIAEFGRRVEALMNDYANDPNNNVGWDILDMSACSNFNTGAPST